VSAGGEREERILAGLGLVSLFLSYAKPSLPFWLDMEDVEQAGILGLIRAVDSFDPERGAFAPYAWLCIRRAVYDELRSAVSRAGLRPTPKRAATMDDALLSALAAPPESDGVMARDLQRAVATALSRTTNKRGPAIARQRFWRGRTYPQMRFGVKKERLYQIWRETRDELREELTRMGYGDG